ncbi:hypothetical protein [Paenibacillus gallinarum]|uniref:Aminodeoxychorismate lyase n=1 Tax=Paenibacillus gallinarum TaxID=2762232 RepID=A0ABR8SUR8_9BACL|nr:hypothetical protein [Paenibacillus gallinarum]MBD7967248.1 hypothetical protein [Paenibacillus gallinarum]
MMKNRSFLMGLGIGIAACALILKLALIGQGAAEGNVKNLLSRTDLEEQAKTMNLKVYDVNEEVMTEEEWAELKGEGARSEETESDAATDSPEKPKVPQNETPEKPKQPTSEKTTEPTNSTEVVKYKVIQGATLNDVADHLSSLHVIQDLDAFLKEANRQKINRKIQTGTYEFQQNESTNSIIKKITTAP